MGLVSLSVIPAGGSVTVRSTGALDTTATRRLHILGVCPGRTMTVVAHSAGGSRIVGVGAARLALDSRVVAQLTVEDAP